MKKIKIWGVFITFILSVICHFIYDLIPNDIFTIFVPVNESIWEHMKLILTTNLFFSIFEYLIYRNKGIRCNNFLLSYAVANLIGIITYLIIYIPLDNIFGHIPLIAILLLFIIFIMIQVISYYIMNSKKFKYSNVFGLLLIIIMYFIFGYFTYNPPKIKLFYDYMHKQYGIVKIE